jgi:hypothetical protein
MNGPDKASLWRFAVKGQPKWAVAVPILRWL